MTLIESWHDHALLGPAVELADVSVERYFAVASDMFDVRYRHLSSRFKLDIRNCDTGSENLDLAYFNSSCSELRTNSDTWLSFDQGTIALLGQHQ
jgi:hypothetical protein